MDNTTILSVTNISKNYPGVQALSNVSLDFKQGEVHALVGENGAGKSTLVKIISGAEQPDSGKITFMDTPYAHLTPHLSRELGIEVIYQEFNLIPSLSVAENVFFGSKQASKYFVNYEKLNKDANAIFASMNAHIDPTKTVEDVSVAYMQLVEIAKAISKEAKIIIMDEPTAPLTISEVDILFKLIENLKKKGVTIIYISHRLEEIFEIGDRVSVLRDGKLITVENIGDTNRKELIRHMVGRTLEEEFPERSIDLGETVFKAKNLSGNGVKDINFKVRAGEIIGLGGLVGAGRTELARIIFGADKADSGEILLDGKSITVNSPNDGVSFGMGMVPEDRKNHGVLLGISVKDNTTLPVIEKLSKAGFVNQKKEQSIVDNLIRKLKIKTPSKDQLAKNLSGGNQQKVVLAKWLAGDSRLLIFDEPTRGVDVGAKFEIYETMNQLAEQGIAIIMISSDMPELLGMSDRIVILCEGKQTGILEKDQFDQELILHLASGDVL